MSGSPAVVQHDPDRRPTFIHRARRKFAIGDEGFNTGPHEGPEYEPKLLMEDFAPKFLGEFRELNSQRSLSSSAAPSKRIQPYIMAQPKLIHLDCQQMTMSDCSMGSSDNSSETILRTDDKILPSRRRTRSGFRGGASVRIETRIIVGARMSRRITRAWIENIHQALERTAFTLAKSSSQNHF